MKLKFVNSIQFVKISVYFKPTIQELVKHELSRIIRISLIIVYKKYKKGEVKIREFDTVREN